MQDSPIAPIVNLLSAQSSPQIINTPETIDYTSTPDMIVAPPPAAPKLQRKNKVLFTQPPCADGGDSAATGGGGTLAQQKLFASCNTPLTPR